MEDQQQMQTTSPASCIQQIDQALKRLEEDKKHDLEALDLSASGSHDIDVMTPEQLSPRSNMGDSFSNQKQHPNPQLYKAAASTNAEAVKTFKETTDEEHRVMLTNGSDSESGLKPTELANGGMAADKLVEAQQKAFEASQPNVEDDLKTIVELNYEASSDEEFL